MNRSAYLLIAVFTAIYPTAGWAQGELKIEVAATGGFAGVSQVQVQTEPHLTCDTATPPQCKPDPDNVNLVKNRSYNWRPATSAGIVFRWLLRPPTGDDKDAIGIGIGGHVVAVPIHTDDIAPAPALTVHVGTARMQVFGGVIFAPTDDATLPGNADRVVVPKTFDPSSLVRPNAARGPNLFVGIVIGGASLKK